MLCAGIKTQKSALLSDEYDHFELSLRKRDVHRSSVSFHDFLYRRNTDSVRRGVGFIGDKALSSHPDPVAFCDNCDAPLYKGDSIYMHINEENLCEVCMNDMYRRIL